MYITRQQVYLPRKKQLTENSNKLDFQVTHAAKISGNFDAVARIMQMPCLWPVRL